MCLFYKRDIFRMWDISVTIFEGFGINFEEEYFLNNYSLIYLEKEW